MRVIVTGGTGLIGRRLVPELVHAGHETIVLSRNPNAVQVPFPDGVTLNRWDALTPEGWGHLISADTAIVNLAGENVLHWRWTLTHRRIVLRSRLDAVQAVLQAVETAPETPRVLIQASAVGYYGTRGDMALGEVSPPGTGWRAEVCKLWEAEVELIESLGVRHAMLRIGTVLERGGGALPLLALGARFMASRLGSGTQWFPWVHNADVAGAIRYIIENETLSGPVNLVAPEPVPNTVLMHELGHALRWPAFIPVPGPLLRLAVGEMATTILDSQRVYPTRLNTCGYRFHYPVLSDALDDLLRGSRQGISSQRPEA